MCGEDCKQALLNKHRKRTETQERHRKRRHGGPSSELRERVRRRDHNVCRMCSKRGYRMEVHHIRYRSQGGEDWITNLILLCDEHHGLVHSDKRRWQPILLATLWRHYVEGINATIPETERWLISRGLVTENQ